MKYNCSVPGMDTVQYLCLDRVATHRTVLEHHIR
jgi:hypothetical protein